MTTDTRPLVRVVAGIVLNADGDYLLSSRPEGKPYAGYWEFAGGKVEAGETDFQALQREFEEELGIRILAATPWLTKIHSYEHARVCLNFLWVGDEQWTGVLQAREGQEWAWQKAGDFTVAPMLPANAALLRALSVPRVWQGSLQTGLHGSNGMGAYRVAPYGQSIEDCDAVCIDAASLSSGKAAQNEWIVVENEAQWQQACSSGADVAVWRVRNGESAECLLSLLRQGVSMPLIAAADGSGYARYRQAWLDAGAHAVVSDSGKAD